MSIYSTIVKSNKPKQLLKLAATSVAVLLPALFLFGFLFQIQEVRADDLPSLVQDAEAGIETENQVSATFPSAPAEGDLIVVVCAGSNAIDVPAGGFSTAILQSGGVFPTQGIFYKIAGPSEPDTFTCKNQGAAKGIGIHMYAIRNINKNDPLGPVGSATGTSNNPNSGSVTLGNENHYVVAAVVLKKSTTLNNVWTNDFTEITDFNTTKKTFGSAHRTRTSAGTFSTDTVAGVSATWRGQIVAFKASSTQQSLFGGDSDSLSSTATEYAPLVGDGGDWSVGDNDSWNATETFRQQLISVPGTISGLRVRLNTAPGAGASYQFMVRKNGADTSATCTISGTATTCFNALNGVSVVAGDTVAIQSVPTNNPTATPAQWSVLFNGNLARESIMLTGTGSGTLGTTTQFLGFGGVNTPFEVGDQARANALIAASGTIGHLDVTLDVAPGAGESRTLTLMKNGVATSLSCTISGVAATTCSDTTNIITVAVGDEVSLRSTANITPASAHAAMGVRFKADTDGEFITTYTAGGIVGFDPGLGFGDAASPEYFQVASWAYDPNPSDTAVQLTQAFTAKHMQIKLSLAPSSGHSRTFILRKNRVDTALSCTISDTATTCSATVDVVFADGDTIDWKVQSTTGADASTGVEAGLRGFISQ